MRRLAAFVSVAILGLNSGLSILAGAQGVLPPKKDGSVRFAVIGDSGTGGSSQLEWRSSWKHRARGSPSNSR